MSTEYENTDLTCALESLVNGTIDVKFFTMMATDPDTPANDGSFRPLKVRTREGSVFHAKEPAAIGFYFETEARVYDLVWRCPTTHIAERLPAGHFSSTCGTFLGGIHPDTGQQYTIIEPQLGGWSACRPGPDTATRQNVTRTPYC